MTCLRCGARSENNSDFLEIEVNLEVGLLMDTMICRSSSHGRTMLRSKAVLKRFFDPRHYLGIISKVSSWPVCTDPAESFIRYRCSKCQSLEDATRQLILQKLPPVLHFSLLRFVFDVMTLERKKRKHNISFPVVLDMNRYLHNQDPTNQENIYELKGVLIHKGSSAYHGHYEAMVFDAT